VDTLTRQQRSAAMSAVRGKDTKPELIVRRLLHALGFRYRLHIKDLPGKPDIVFRKRKCVIFVNGCFWHGHDCPRGGRPTSNVEFWQQKIGKNLERDRRVTEELNVAGWRALTVWECETKKEDLLAKRFRAFLRDKT
jgi:DNA mismatch endonuclease, patch repair protein